MIPFLLHRTEITWGTQDSTKNDVSNLSNVQSWADMNHEEENPPKTMDTRPGKRSHSDCWNFPIFNRNFRKYIDSIRGPHFPATAMLDDPGVYPKWRPKNRSRFDTGLKKNIIFFSIYVRFRGGGSCLVKVPGSWMRMAYEIIPIEPGWTGRLKKIPLKWDMLRSLRSFGGYSLL